MADIWTMVEFWIMVDFWFMGDFWITSGGTGRQADTQADFNFYLSKPVNCVFETSLIWISVIYSFFISVICISVTCIFGISVNFISVFL